MSIKFHVILVMASETLLSLNNWYDDNVICIQYLLYVKPNFCSADAE